MAGRIPLRLIEVGVPFAYFNMVNAVNGEKKNKTVQNLGLPESTGYITTLLLDGSHDLLTETVRFMVAQEERHPNELHLMEYRQYLDERVLDVQWIFENKLFDKLSAVFGEKAVLREEIVLDKIGTAGWAEEISINPYVYHLEIYAEGHTVSGLPVHLTGIAKMDAFTVHSLHFTKIVVGENELACSLCIVLDNVNVCAFMYDSCHIVLSQRVSDLYLALADSFCRRYIGLRKPSPYQAIAGTQQGISYVKTCIPFSLGTKDVRPKEEGCYPLIQIGQYRLETVDRKQVLG